MVAIKRNTHTSQSTWPAQKHGRHKENTHTDTNYTCTYFSVDMTRTKAWSPYRETHTSQSTWPAQKHGCRKENTHIHRLHMYILLSWHDPHKSMITIKRTHTCTNIDYTHTHTSQSIWPAQKHGQHKEKHTHTHTHTSQSTWPAQKHGRRKEKHTYTILSRHDPHKSMVAVKRTQTQSQTTHTHTSQSTWPAQKHGRHKEKHTYTHTFLSGCDLHKSTISS